jgi:site-specific DNA recombinase
MTKIITKLPSKINKIPVKTKVAAYVRISSGKDTMLHSMAAQVSYYQNLIRSHPDWTFSGVYVDEAMTGTKSNRPDFQRMLNECRTGRIEEIITKSISRFARNTVSLLATVRELKSIGVDVYFERENIHSTSKDGELLLTILASYAQEESLSASENVKWRIRQDFKNGKPGNLKIYGYDMINGQLVVNEPEAATVKMIFADYLAGMGKNAIVRRLRGLEIPTKTNSKWVISTIHAILRDEKYTGCLLMQKTYRSNHLTKVKKFNTGELAQYYVENSHEAIISYDLFEKVQKEIIRRKKKYMPHPKTPAFSEFTSKIQCGNCGANFHRKTTNAGTKYAANKWVCSTYSEQGSAICCMKPVPEEVLKRLAVEVLEMDAYDHAALADKIRQIIIPRFGEVEFHMVDGRRELKTWKYQSRRETWKRKREKSMKGN